MAVNRLKIWKFKFNKYIYSIFLLFCVPHFSQAETAILNFNTIDKSVLYELNSSVDFLNKIKPIYDEKDFRQLAIWLQREVKKENNIAMFLLARLFENGEGVDKDLKKSFDLYKMSADAGFSAAPVFLAKMYIEGVVVQKNEEKIIYYLKKSAEKNIYDAKILLADEYYFGTNIGKNIKQAVYWYERSLGGLVKNKRYDILESLAVSYGFGQGVKKNTQKSITLYEKAIELGSVDSHYHLASLYAQDKNSKNHTRKIYKHLKYAAELGVKNAQLSLGHSYEFGQYSDIDLEKARFWYEKSAKNGIDEAKKIIKLRFNNPINGYGTHETETYRYKGYFKNRKYHGKGIIKYKNGSKYEGNFFEGLMAGHGVMYLNDGTSFVGNYEQGERHGAGRTMWKDGSILSGVYYEGKLHGESIYQSGNEKYLRKYNYDALIFEERLLNNSELREVIKVINDDREYLLKNLKFFKEQSLEENYRLANTGLKLINKEMECLKTPTESAVSKCIVPYMNQRVKLLQLSNRILDLKVNEQAREIRKNKNRKILNFANQLLNYSTGHTQSTYRFPKIYRSYDKTRGYITNNKGGLTGTGLNVGQGFRSDGNGGFIGTGSNIGGGYEADGLGGYRGVGKFQGDGWVADGLGGFRGTGGNMGKEYRQ